MTFYVVKCHVEIGLRLLAPDGGKAVEKSFECFSGFEVVDQGLDGHTRSSKDELTAEDIGVARHDAGSVWRTVIRHGSAGVGEMDGR